MTNRTKNLQLHIDWTRCDGRGLCTELLPEILGRDEWGYPLARDGAREPVIPRAAEAYAHAAVRRCPLQALSLVIDASKPPRQKSRAATRR